MPGRFVEKDRVGRARGPVSPEFSAKRPLPEPCALLANWWKGRDSNPRPRHYELEIAVKISLNFNDLPSDARCDYHDRAQPSTADSRKSPARPLSDISVILG